MLTLFSAADRAQTRPNAPFWDPAAPRSAFINTLPDPLRVKANGLQQHQLSVYEDFAAEPRPGQISTENLPYMRSPSVDHTGLGHQEVMERFGVSPWLLSFRNSFLTARIGAHP